MKYRWLLSSSLIFVAGCTSASGQAGRQGGRNQAVAIDTVAVAHMSIQRSVDLAGNLISPDQAKVSAEAAGVVQSVTVRLGDEVGNFALPA